ncbi:unnamed protein product [Symbiodinium sp. KB8]|nr:unnamed protein product [Symbiodinium sp. KB8]
MFAVVLLLQALHSASSVGLESSPPPQAEAFLQDDECQSPSNTESAQCALNALQIDRTASEEAGTQEAEYNSTSQRQGYDSINFQPDPYGQEYVIFDNRHFATKATVSVWQLRNVEIQRGYTALIKDLGRRSAWAAALSVLSEATCHDISNGTVSAALAAFHKASQWTWALQLFESMPSLKVLQDAVAHNTTAAACLKSGHWAKALSVLHKAFHGKLHPTVVTFNTAISACEKGFKWEGALNLLKALVESPNLQPNVATCTAAMSSCCRGFSWEKALAIMAAMKDPDAPLPRPDLIAYNALVSSCERASAWETALALVADLSQSLKPDVFTLGACLAACQRSRQWLLALHLVQSSQTDWAVQPDVVAYSAAISACSEGEGWEAAFRLAEQMAKDGVEQNNFTCSALIKAAEHGRQWALALEMLSRHERQFHSPDLVMLSSIMCACGVSYQWARTLQLLAELPRRSLRPDIVAYGVVIDACASATQWLQAVALLDDLRSARWSPNVVVYEKLFASFERSGCWEEAIALLDELCEQQLMPDANTWRAVLRACEESSMWQAAVELVAAMRRSSPNHGTCSENDMKEQGLTYDSAGSITHVGLFLIHADVASWHRDACPREHSEMALKRWAVRQLSGFLSDYLEGITEQNLQASLSLEVGEVEIRHVRVHGELLKDQHFSLLSSDVSVFARIPWRNLGSEPTVITVKDVWIEVEARAEASAKSVDPAEARAKAEEELQRWRERKRSKVEARVESARLANTEEAQPRRGMAARLGHAALRQLQVRVDGLRARVHNEVVSSTLDLSLVRLALDEGSSNPDHRTEVPAEVQRHPASLDKILELVGLCGQRTISSKDSSNLWPSLRKHDNERNFTVELKYALRFHCRHRGIMELGSSVQAPVARAHAARIDEPRGAPARGIQAATQRKRFATAIGFGISLNLAWAGQAQARSRSLRKAHGQGRHGRREVLSIGVVTPLVAPLAAKAEAEPPTVSKKVAEGVYIFDQAYGIPGLGVGANIPIRMTVLSLEGGGYLVYNPCHPTAEAMQMLKEFGLTDVRYIVCGTVAIEHKYYAPQWAQLFPKAEVWISPRTFSWPVDFGPYVPVGGFSRSTPLQKIPKDASLAPWSSKGIDHLQLTVDYAPRTVFEETVLFHKPSGSFVCTDMLIGLSDEPPEILTLSPYKEGLLWFSRDEPLEEVDVSSPKTLKDGYQKSVLLLNNINPRSLLSVAAGDLAVPEQLGLASKAPQKDLGYFGWYPCNWQASDSPCAKLDDRLLPSKGSKTFDCRPGWRGEWTRLAAGVEGTGFQVPSFVAELQVSRDPETLDSFAKEISRRWPGIKKVISSHFSSPLPASSENVSKAISAVCRGPPGPAARAADLSAILNFRDYLEENVSEASAAIKLSPANAQPPRELQESAAFYCPEGMTQIANPSTGGDAVDVVPLPSGTEYSEMCVRRAKGDQLQGDEHRLTEIEDLAPVEWLARWQLRSLEQLGHESVASQPPARRGFVGWLRGASDRATATASQGEDDEALEDIVEEAGKQSFFEEVEEPRKLEVRLAIPHCTILSCSPALSSSPVPDLCIEGGVQCQLSLATAREGSMANFMKAAWDADVSANLSSVAVLLGKADISMKTACETAKLELRRASGRSHTARFPDSMPKTVSDADDEECGTWTVSSDVAHQQAAVACFRRFFDVQSDIEETTDSALQEAAVTLRLHVARFGGWLELLALGTTRAAEAGEAWRDAETNGWDFSLESPSVRWIVDPLFLKVAGQLPISLDHAISPLRDVMSQVLTDPGVSSANAEGTLAQSQEAKVPQEPGGKVHPKVHVKLSIATTQLVLYPASGHKVSLELDGILAQYSGYESRNDISGEVALCHLSCDSTVLVSFTRGASLQVRSADHHVNVRGGSTLIAVRWHEHPIREVLGAFYEAWEALAAGHEHVQGILPVGDSAGMFAKLWGAYVVHPIQARVKQKAAQRLAELVPGVEQGARHAPMDFCPEDTEQESHKSNEDAECLQPRGSCSVEVVLFYEGLDIVFPGSEHREGPTDGPPVVQVGVNGAECSFRAFQSGDASAAVSLVAVTLELDGRRLLMPRRGEKLLKVNILHRSRVEPALSWTASWAQICILFRQRDYDMLVAFVSKSIKDAMPSRRWPEALPGESGGQVEKPDATKRNEVEQPGARFQLDIGAPMVFLQRAKLVQSSCTSCTCD